MADKKVVNPPQDPLLAVLGPSLRVGAACGSAGFIVGGAAGVIKSTTPFLFASASGLQTFALGTTFWGCRTAVLQAWTPEHQKPKDLVAASSISGGVTGAAVASLIRGRSNVLPGAFMFALFGFLGQTASNKWFDRSADVGDQPKEGFWRRMSEKPWSPVTVMNDAEYAEMLKEKMLKVDVEISILEDKLAVLRKQQEEGERNQTNASPSPPPK